MRDVSDPAATVAVHDATPLERLPRQRGCEAAGPAALRWGPLLESCPRDEAPAPAPVFPCRFCLSLRARAAFCRFPQEPWPLSGASLLEGTKPRQLLVGEPKTQGFVTVKVRLFLHPQKPPGHRMLKHTLPPPTRVGIVK